MSIICEIIDNILVDVFAKKKSYLITHCLRELKKGAT